MVPIRERATRGRDRLSNPTESIFPDPAEAMTAVSG
jgi:hypothetical protein